MKEEKNKVGRPKLADKETKKKAVLLIIISTMLILFLGVGFALNAGINIRLNNLKGETSINSEICPGVIQKISGTSIKGKSVIKNGKTSCVQSAIKSNSYELNNFFEVYLGGKLLQNFEVTDKYIYASYRAKNYENKKTTERRLSTYDNNAATTIKRYEYTKYKSKLNISKINYIVLTGAGHSQLFDVSGNDTIYSNAKPFFDTEINMVVSPAFQILKYPASQSTSKSYPNRQSSYAYSNNNGYTVVYNTETTIKSDSYYFNINNNLNDSSASLLYESYYNENYNKYKDNKMRNIQFAVDKENELIAIQPFKVKKIYIFKLNLKKDGENKPVGIINLCNSNYSCDYSCTQGDGNQGIAFYNKTIYIASGGSDVKDGEYKSYKAPKIIKINLNDKLNESKRETIAFNFRTALNNFCKSKNYGNSCSKDNFRICYTEKEAINKITLETEGISASKNGVYLGLVYKINGGKKFNYIYKLSKF